MKSNMEKIDMVMWAKNGALTLPLVLKRVEEVIPSEVINKKIFVDDHSTDGSVPIARDFGWSVFQNIRGGVDAGANLALRQVTTEYFISLEQDVYLAKNWWERIPRYLKRNDIAVAQGWRISNHPVIKKIDEYSMERFRYSLCSIDNTIYKTRIVRALGGFSEHLKYPGVDAYIHQRVLNAGFKWITDSSVLSIHFRMGELRE
ncbi:glycosyltransferase family 2 protein [Candidatus Bathyarchaeota archaeon]|nr:glycosyltransferase family 2 protein [Candidatus Bathyarchaeota archaeon]